MKYYILSSQENMIHAMFEKFSYFIVFIFIGLVVIAGIIFLKEIFFYFLEKRKKNI